MHARVSMLEGPTDHVDTALDTMHSTVMPQLEVTEGFRGVLVFGNRANGKSISVTLWETEDAMKASREAANIWRQQIADAESGSITGVEEFEILMEDRR
jgi:heme-degrading monooxygenase HmoA